MTASIYRVKMMRRRKRLDFWYKETLLKSPFHRIPMIAISGLPDSGVFSWSIVTRIPANHTTSVYPTVISRTYDSLGAWLLRLGESRQDHFNWLISMLCLCTRTSIHLRYIYRRQFIHPSQLYLSMSTTFSDIETRTWIIRMINSSTFLFPFINEFIRSVDKG